MARTYSQHYARTVVDVATEEACPAREWTDEGDPRPHEIEAGGSGAHRPGRAAENPVWACRWCDMSWAELDDRSNAALRTRRK